MALHQHKLQRGTGKGLCFMLPFFFKHIKCQALKNTCWWMRKPPEREGQLIQMWRKCCLCRNAVLTEQRPWWDHLVHVRIRLRRNIELTEQDQWCHLRLCQNLLFLFLCCLRISKCGKSHMASSDITPSEMHWKSGRLSGSAQTRVKTGLQTEGRPQAVWIVFRCS